MTTVPTEHFGMATKATATRRRNPAPAAAPAGPYSLNGKAADVWEFIRGGKVVATMDKLSGSLITTADAANREQAAAMLAELNRAAAPAAPPPAADGPGVAGLVRCLTDLRAEMDAAGDSRIRGTRLYRPWIARIDAALSSSPEAELAAAVGGANVSPRDRDVVAAVLAYRRANGGLNPSLSELGEAMGISKVVVHEHLNRLVGLGVVARDAKHAARQIRLVNIDGRK